MCIQLYVHVDVLWKLSSLSRQHACVCQIILSFYMNSKKKKTELCKTVQATKWLLYQFLYPSD